MTTIFGEHIPAIGDVFKTDPVKDSGNSYEITGYIPNGGIKFRILGQNAYGNWSKERFNEYVNEKRLIFVENGNKN